MENGLTRSTKAQIIYKEKAYTQKTWPILAATWTPPFFQINPLALKGHPPTFTPSPTEAIACKYIKNLFIFLDPYVLILLEIGIYYFVVFY